MKRISETYVRSNFGLIWPRHVEAFATYLIECRKHFKGDLDLLLILAIIGDRTLSASKVPKRLTYNDVLEGKKLELQSEPINLQSIADFSGIPRESVRRKVNDLIDLGWVEKTDEGFLVATSKAARDLAPLTESGFSYLIRMADVLAPPDK